MNGRLEKELKVYQKIEQSLDMLPKFISNWYYYLKANENTSSTCNDYINKAKSFLSFINKENTWLLVPEDITDDVVIKYFVNIQTKQINKDGKVITENTSDSYKQGIWSCLNNLFDFLVSTDEIPYNYITKLKIKRPKNKDLPRIERERILLDEEDFKAILDAVETGAGSKKAKSFQKRFKTRDLCIMHLFMTTGMRESALAAINIDDIDFEKKILSITDKGDKILDFYLSDKDIEIIEDWLIDRTLLLCGKVNYPPLFLSRDCNRLSVKGISKLVAKYSIEGLGYRLSPHKLRGGYINIVQNTYHDVELTRIAVGHANISTTQRYFATDYSERKQAREKMQELLY